MRKAPRPTSLLRGPHGDRHWIYWVWFAGLGCKSFSQLPLKWLETWTNRSSFALSRCATACLSACSNVRRWDYNPSYCQGVLGWAPDPTRLSVRVPPRGPTCGRSQHTSGNISINTVECTTSKWLWVSLLYSQQYNRLYSQLADSWWLFSIWLSITEHSPTTFMNTTPTP